MANGRTLATGPMPQSRGSRLGEILGAGMGQGAANSFERQRRERQAMQQFNPIRESLAASLGDNPSTPQQRMLQSLAQDPQAFANFMANPESVATASAVGEMAAEPQVESQFPELNEINETQRKAERARENGEIRRAEIWEARAQDMRELAGLGPNMPNHELVQRVLPNNDIQTLWADSEGKNFYDMSGNPVQLGEDDRVLEGASLTGGREQVLPASDEVDLRKAQATTESFIATADDALQMLNENPDVATWTGRASGFINDMRQEAEALARNTGIEFDTSSLNPETNADTFRELGIRNSQWRGIVNSLAFRAASAEAGQEGRAVSNEDVKRFITIIGAGGSDPDAIRRNLTDVAGRIDRDFRTQYRTLRQEDFEGDLGLGRLPTGGPQGAADSFSTVEEVDQADPDILSNYVLGLSEAEWNELDPDVQDRISRRLQE